MTICYVAGFMFNSGFTEVLLVRKQRPDWQKGKLNGVGGHIEPGEDPVQAMQREFLEETGLLTACSDWHEFCTMGGTNNNGEKFAVTFFWSKGLCRLARSRDEPLEVLYLDEIHALRPDVIGNLPWLVTMAHDFAVGVHPPSAVLALYSPQK